MTEASGGEDDWLERALREHEHALLSYATKLLGDRERARDVVQDTFLRLCQQPRGKVNRGVKTWLFVTCRRRALDVRRKENRMHPVDSTPDRPDPADDPAQRAEADERQRLIRERIAHLPERQQEVLHLKFGGGLSYREIAETTGLKSGYVGYLIHHGLKNLRDALTAPEA